jgi:hypothetical protein
MRGPRRVNPPCSWSRQSLRSSWNLSELVPRRALRCFVDELPDLVLGPSAVQHCGHVHNLLGEREPWQLGIVRDAAE